MEEGVQKGRQEGRQDTLLSALQKLMIKSDMSFLGACDFLDIPQADRPALEQLLAR